MPEANGAKSVARKRWRRWATTARTWHRRIGLVVAVLVAVVAVTGLLLNHGDRLNLDRTNIVAGWVVDWYGLYRMMGTHIRFSSPILFQT